MTREDKQAFFAQYWGQKVGITGYALANDLPDRIRVTGLSVMYTAKCIELKPLSAISNEDKKEYQDKFKQTYDPDTLQWFQDEADWLRSKGYALSFRSHSVEDLIEAGVLKLSGR